MSVYGSVESTRKDSEEGEKGSLAKIFSFTVLAACIVVFGYSYATSTPASSQVSFSTVFYSDAALADEIVDTLPNYIGDSYTFRQFSGYLDTTDTKKSFYWFVESQNDPVNDPIVLWTNGGPGCSGLIGFFGEHGPFRITSDIEVDSIDYSWNNIANMLYIEQPTCVGFSYETDSTECSADDLSASDDNYLLVTAFFEKFSSLASNDFYLSGESYGGHYVPQLALKISEEVAAGNSSINLKGFLVGNPFTDPVENMHGMYDTFWGHQLVPESVYMEWDASCGSADDWETYYSNTCINLEYSMWDLVGDVDPYGVDFDVCNDDDSTDDTKDNSGAREGSKSAASRVGKAQRKRLMETTLPKHLREKYYGKSRRLGEISTEYIPCEEDYYSDYLNTDSVKTAIHAESSITWSYCSYNLNYDYDDELFYVETVYQKLIDEYDIKILVYSGDDDTVCGTIGTQKWLWSLGYDMTSSWEAWYVSSQVAGYKLSFEGISFATIHDAGHEVPAYQPERMFNLFEDFLTS